ncbi:hypothetical protein WMF30_00890 [Sorangium sp. So ce134]
MKPRPNLPALALPGQLSLGLHAAPRDLPELPELVRARTLRQPWAGLVAAVPPGERVGLKDLETREYRIAPGPLVVCAGLQADAEWTARLLPRVPAWALPLLEIRGQALALVMIGESRPLVPEDEERAWFWAPGRKAMVIERCWPFRRPFAQRGMPGEFAVERARVLEALAA